MTKLIKESNQVAKVLDLLCAAGEPETLPAVRAVIESRLIREKKWTR